jgi:xylitol oxidase
MQLGHGADGIVDRFDGREPGGSGSTVTEASSVANWAGNERFTPARVHRPSDLGDLQAIVAGAKRAKALGTRHSFNRLADTSGDLIVTSGLPKRIEIDVAARTATVSASVRYADLSPLLAGHGLALPNLASLPHISVAGACATGTHGSGDRNGVLATAVSAMTLVGSDGGLRFPRGAELAAAVVGLGALGIVAELTLDLVPSYRIQQYVYDGLQRVTLLSHLDEIFGSALSVSVFTDWSASSAIWVKRLATDPPAEPTWFGARLADGQRPAGPGVDPRSGTPQLGVPGLWHERLPHFRAEFNPSRGAELQSEYFVPRERAAAAIAAVFDLGGAMTPVLHIGEIRTVAADELWLSPAYGRDTVALHFTWRPDAAAVRTVLAQLEDRLAPFSARPHWGKVFSTNPAVLAKVYPRLRDFAALARELDPGGTFANEFLARHVLG